MQRSDHREPRDLSGYSMRDKARIARTARRNLNSETTFVLTAGFSFFAVILFASGRYTFLPLAETTGIPATIIWMGLSFVAAALCAVVNRILSEPRVRAARELNAAFLYQYQDDQRRTREDGT